MFPSALKIWIQILVCSCLSTFEWTLRLLTIVLVSSLIKKKKQDYLLHSATKVVWPSDKASSDLKENQGEDSEGSHKL